MSLISKQVDDLRDYAKSRRGELARIINGAADTIESLSEKLSARNMECSSAYYHGGWIPCDDSLPVKVGSYLACSERGTVFTVLWLGNHWGTDGVIAWAELPEPYRKEGKHD